MPELPEVETVRTVLKPLVKGLIINDVKVYWPKMLRQELTVSQFVSTLKNQTFLDIKRLGKHLIFHLSDCILLSHLRMEGNYFVTKKTSDLDNNHVLVIFNLSNDTYLCYHDTRRFGTMLIRDYANYLSVPPLSSLGLEPFDSNLSATYLRKAFKNSRRAVKTALLDQSIIAGIGNIYANEILYLAKINPFTPVQNLNLKQLNLIIKYAKEVLQKAIALGGTTINSFQINKHITGKFQNLLLVHEKANQKCLNCQSLIVRAVINQRSAYYCPVCQK